MTNKDDLGNGRRKDIDKMMTLDEVGEFYEKGKGRRENHTTQLLEAMLSDLNSERQRIVSSLKYNYDVGFELTAKETIEDDLYSIAERYFYSKGFKLYRRSPCLYVERGDESLLINISDFTAWPEHYGNKKTILVSLYNEKHLARPKDEIKLIMEKENDR